ncbi:MAG: abortive infection family protein [Thiolinea sp.]|jgi:hypothetical protein
MPLQLSADLRFPIGIPYPLKAPAIEDFLSLTRRINCSSYGKQNILETFKENFCRASGGQYHRSSALRWVEQDLESAAHEAATNAAAFISALVDSFDELKNKNISVPDYELINRILEKHDINLRIKDNRLIAAGFVTTPELALSQVETVERALADARTLIATAGASSAIDRLHTALHGYLMHLCKTVGIDVSEVKGASRAFKMLREQHPAFATNGHMGKEVNQLLQGFATAIDAFSQLRNNASLAHANQLLEEPEATVVVNGTFTIFCYIQDCLNRYTK